MAEKNYDAVIQRGDTFLAVDGKNVEARNMVGAAHLAKKEYAKATAAYPKPKGRA